MIALQDAIERALDVAALGKSEDFVREELILPILIALGYDGASVFRIRRGVRLVSTGQTRIHSERNHQFPDFVLEVLDTPVWILDAKSGKVPLEKPTNVSQIRAYASDPSL